MENKDLTTKDIQDNFKNLLDVSDEIYDLENLIKAVPSSEEPKEPASNDEDKKEDIGESTPPKVEDLDIEEFEDAEIEDETATKTTDNANNSDKKQNASKTKIPAGTEDFLSDLLTPEQKKELLEIKDKDKIAEKTKQFIKENIEDIKKETLVSFYDSLPEEAQLLIQYILNEGTDVKDFMKTLIDGTVDTDRMSDEDVVREYFKSKNFSDQDIEDEIRLYKEKGVLGQKASKYRSEIENMSDNRLKEKIKEQEEIKKRKQEYTKWYAEELKKTLESFPANVRSDIAVGLLNSDKRSLSGHKINELYYLLEEYQIRKPDLKRVAEALWLLKDPDGFKNNIKETFKNEIIDTELKKHLKKATDKITSKSNTLVDDTTARSSTSSYSYRPSKNANMSAFRNIIFGND